MAKQLNFTYKNKEYTLEYTRRTVTEMERRGFSVDDVNKKPMTTLPALFAGAFLAHHRNVRQAEIDEIFSHMTNKEDLISKLAEMYAEPITTLVDDPAENDKGNVDWTATF